MRVNIFIVNNNESEHFDSNSESDTNNNSEHFNSNNESEHFDSNNKSEHLDNKRNNGDYIKSTLRTIYQLSIHTYFLVSIIMKTYLTIS